MNQKWIQVLQWASISFMWVFVVTITVWITNLIRVAHELQDALNASVGISIVAIPLFWFLAAVLTYVFFGLRQGREKATRTGGRS
jgi:hypothetical protein